MPFYKVTSRVVLEMLVMAKDEDAAAECIDEWDYEDMKELSWEVVKVEEQA